MHTTEHEYKRLLTPEEYMTLLTKLDSIAVCRPYVQVNYYYDDEVFSLNEKGETLRVRQQLDKLTLERKFHRRYSQEGERICEEKSEPIQRLPAKISIGNQEYRYIGNLVTTRRDYTIGKNIVSLDVSYYLGRVDFELEIESKEEVVLPEFLREIMDGCARPDGKYTRFVRALREMEGK